MIHIRLLHHRRHGLFDRPLLELVERVLVPDLLEVEIRPVQMLLDEGERARVRDACRRGDEVAMAREDELRRRGLGVGVDFGWLGLELVGGWCQV